MKDLLKTIVLPMAVLAVAVSCSRIPESDQDNRNVTIIGVSAPSSVARVSRTYMGDSDEGKRPVYWSEGDRLSLNGTESEPLSGVTAGQRAANFTFPGVIGTPYRILYPSRFYKDASTITLPGTQTFAEGTYAPNTAPLCAYAENGSDPIVMNHLTATVHLSLKKDAGVSASNLVSVRFKGNDSEQVCGDFTIDYQNATITPTGEGSEVSLSVNKPLSETDALELFLVVPARTYSAGFTVVMEDAMHRTMTKVKQTSATLGAGKLVKMTEFSFVPSALASSFEIADVIEEVLPPDDYNVTGRVVDNSGKGLEGVVVSDGKQCVRTMLDGSFYITSDLSSVKFVHVSTPSGYKPQVEGGIPKFYKAKADITPSNGIYNFGDFTLTAVDNPNRYTLLITADPQPRANNWTLDKIAYKSLDACEDLYDELADVKAGISGREVYGICLGDIVHENMSLFANYNTGLARLGYPTYNVIGNHDNNPSATTDDEGAAVFESYYGPRNYSFNIGGIHFVVVDNIIMSQNPDEGNQLTGMTEGLSDDIWTWLRNDLATVPVSTKLMVFSHAPMFKRLTSADRTGGTHPAEHGADYGNLINQYFEIHAWAGHTHVGFNYVYPGSHRHKRVQVHTLARSTGELWTNDYLAAGTPRGFTIVEVDNGEITWRFHPVTRQSGVFQGVSTGYCSAGAPAYTWRDWDYSSGVAVMKDGSGALTESYQLHAYPRGAYDDDYVYANVFLWDEKWELPVWKPDGGTPVTMTRLVSPDTQSVIGQSTDPIKQKIYDAGDTEFRSWYKTFANKDGGSLAGMVKYTAKDSYDANGYLVTIFRAPATASPASGTVSVTDRFGNTYSRRVSW